MQSKVMKSSEPVSTSDSLRTLAFHLPQFHPIPENDLWWGKGFTEWTNVTKAEPSFSDHYQPHLPTDLGYYDLRLPEARQAQADLARQYGIGAFVYYHYWFTGQRILERPVDDILSSRQPDFPFCLCWANENWTRTWDGGSNQVLLEQHYSDADDEAHIRHLLPYLADRRYLRMSGKPLLLLYRTELLPNPARTADTWRRIALREGVGELFLARVESLAQDKDPRTIGFDASIEFAPDWRTVPRQQRGRWDRLRAKLGLIPRGRLTNTVLQYDDLVSRMLAKPTPEYRRYPCVTPGWDNTARRKQGATIFENNSPQAYGRWLQTIAEAELKADRPDGERLVFVNAWNEWAEGNHLEPDRRWGHAFLEATRDALIQAGQQAN